MAKLTTNQAEVLRMAAENEISGECVQYVWRFRAGSRNVTQTVRSLLNKNMVSMLAFSGGRSAISITETGRAALQ